MSNTQDPIPNPAPAPTPSPSPSAWHWSRFIPTNWQSIVGTAAIALVAMVLNWLRATPEPIPVPDPPFPIWQEGEFGWVEPRTEEKQLALQCANVFLFERTEAGQSEPAGDADGNAFLWQLARKAQGGKDVPTLNQGSVGSCVGHGWATGIDYVIAVQAALKIGPPINADVEIAPEVIYGGSRVNANGMRPQLFGDGSNGSWAARFVTTDGVAARGKYGPYDITKYTVSQCRDFGRVGIKGELLDECKKNILGSAALVNNVQDARKAILQGYPIAICSNVGFARQASRDADGFLEARGFWPHCMVIIGYQKAKDAYFCMNSWGENWVGGPLGAGEPPPGGFWMKAETLDKILKQGDSYAISGQRGFPKRKIAADDWVYRKNEFLDPANRWLDPLFALKP